MKKQFHEGDKVTLEDLAKENFIFKDTFGYEGRLYVRDGKLYLLEPERKGKDYVVYMVVNQQRGK